MINNTKTYPDILPVFLLVCIRLLFAQQAADFKPTPIAVMSLEGKGISQQESEILSERLRSALVQDGRYLVIERNQMEEILKEQGFQKSGCVSSECLIQAGQLLGVELLVGGSVGKIGDSYAIDVRLFNVATAEISNAVTRDYRGAIDGLLTIMSEIAFDLAGQSLGNPDLPAPEKIKATPTRYTYNASAWTPIQFAFAHPQQILPEYFKVYGIRVNLIHGKNHSVYGVDIGLLNEIVYDLMGVQYGLKNATGTAYGLQYGLLNSTNKLTGAQIGLINTSNSTIGCQIGLINSSKYLTGVQIGLINKNPNGGGLKSMPLINIGF